MGRSRSFLTLGCLLFSNSFLGIRGTKESVLDAQIKIADLLTILFALRRSMSCFLQSLVSGENNVVLTIDHPNLGCPDSFIDPRPWLARPAFHGSLSDSVLPPMGVRSYSRYTNSPDSREKDQICHKDETLAYCP